MNSIILVISFMAFFVGYSLCAIMNRVDFLPQGVILTCIVIALTLLVLVANI